MIPPPRRYRLLLSAVLLLSAYLIFQIAIGGLLPYLLAVVLAYLLLPVVNYIGRISPQRLRDRGLARPLAIVLVYFSAAAFVALILGFIVPPVIQQLGQLINDAPALYDNASEWFERFRVGYEQSIPGDIRETVESTLQGGALSIMGAAQTGITRTITAVSRIVSFSLGFVVVPFFLFYLLNDESQLEQMVYSVVPKGWQEDAYNLARIVDDILSAYIRGQLILAFFVGLMATVGLTLLKVRFAFLLGIGAGFFEVIPFVGPILGAIPAVILAFLQEPVLALWTLILFAAIQQIENLLLVPRIAGQSVRLHPAVIMVVLVIGNEVGGLLGLLASVPATAVVRDVVKYLFIRLADELVTPAAALQRIRSEYVEIEG